MDAVAQLALMTKAKAVFERDDTFLSFPALSPRVYPPERLKFAKPGGMTAESLADESEFARMTNQIPRGVLAPIEEGEYAWEVYDDVLETAEIARGALSEAEQEQLAKALAVLYTAGEDGSREESQALKAYQQYRDASFEAEEEYKNQQLTAETSDDPTAKARWQNEDEPRLRQEVAQLQQEWITKGFKAEVEAAQQVEQACANREPSTTWEEWKGSFINDLDMTTDTNLINFAVTGFSPYDLFDLDTWPQFTLGRGEISALIAQAPAELKAIFGSAGGTSEIESVSFEYRSVAVTRPWFRPALFKARFWRLPAGHEALSDGMDLTKGRCPAYIAALVFVRNVRIQSQARANATGVVRDHRSLLQISPTMLSPDLAARMRQSAVTTNPGSARLAVRDHRTAGLAAVRTERPAVRDHRLQATAFAARPQIRVIARPGVIRVPTVRPATGGSSAPPATSAMPPTPEVSILAFICKRVPVCPNPDASLTWA